jgi:RNA polymerase sigma-70 factor, ECF subfamily
LLALQIEPLAAGFTPITEPTLHPMPADDAERELIARCLRGEAGAWDAVFDAHYQVTARFIFQLSPDISPDDAEEICQDVFLAAIRNLHTFKGDCQLRTWLFRIAANKARDQREKARAAKRGGGAVPVSLNAEDPTTGLTLDPPTTAPGPDRQLDAREQGQMLHEALAHLGEPCREIIELRYFGDLSYEEISATLQLNPKTVSSRLSKCLDKLEAIARRVFSRETNATKPV